MNEEQSSVGYRIAGLLFGFTARLIFAVIFRRADEAAENKALVIGVGTVGIFLTYLAIRPSAKPVYIDGKMKKSIWKTIDILVLFSTIACLYIIVPSYKKGDLTASEEENQGEEQTADSSDVVEMATPTAVPTKEDRPDRLLEYFSQEFADKIYSILKDDIGYVICVFEKKDGDLDNYIFACYKEDEDGVIDINTDDVYVTAYEDDGYIRVFIPNGITYYEDGQLKATVKNYNSIKQDNRDHYDNQDAYYIIAQSIIKDYVDTSSKMKFPGLYTSDDVRFGWKDKYVGVQSYVEIKNSFGEYVRYDYTVEFIPKDLSQYTYELIYLNFDGQKTGDFINLD